MQAIIVSCCGCFHGRTLAAISMSCDNEATHGFGPLLLGHLKVDFGDEIALEKIFKGVCVPEPSFSLYFVWVLFHLSIFLGLRGLTCMNN